MPSSDIVFEGVAESLESWIFFCAQILKRTAFYVDKAILDTQLRPSVVVFLAVLCTLLFCWLLLSVKRVIAYNFKEVLFSFIRELPLSRRLIQKEQQKLREVLDKRKRQFLQDEKPITSIPSKGWSCRTVLNHLQERNKRDVSVEQRTSKVSGVVYLYGGELEHLLCDVYRIFSLTNPLHPDVFPSVRQMEAEVVSMCGNLLNPTKSAKNVCGAMTGGGSESILSAVKVGYRVHSLLGCVLQACRDYMEAVKHVTEPEMIIANSAHAAYYKAAEYFRINLVVLKIDEKYQLPVGELKRRINDNTILVVASAPGFPHGVIDPIKEISAVTAARGVLLHVDCCLGGFFLPFAKKLGFEVPPFDFTLKGVTSMSVDTHKYGLAHKGSSVVLYRSPALRRYQYTAVSDWVGGMYISPGFAGSRSGALIAVAWASLMYLGEEGYLRVTEEILNAILSFKKKLAYVADLEIIGDPCGTAVALTFKKNRDRIYRLNDLMTEKGWHLSPLQFPPAVHMSFTARHVGSIDRLVQDLRACVEAVKKEPSRPSGGSAAIYGTACTVPDRRVVKDLLTVYQDALLSP